MTEALFIETAKSEEKLKEHRERRLNVFWCAENIRRLKKWIYKLEEKEAIPKRA